MQHYMPISANSVGLAYKNASADRMNEKQFYVIRVSNISHAAGFIPHSQFMAGHEYGLSGLYRIPDVCPRGIPVSGGKLR